MTTVNVYLTFDGNCEAAFNFYKSVFGGEFTFMGRFDEMPDSPEFSIPADQKNRIMHITLPIGGDTVLMGSDTISGFGPEMIVGNNFSISISPESRAAADHFFASLSKDGHATMPMQDQFWGSYYGMCKDKFGINWMINFGES